MSVELEVKNTRVQLRTGEGASTDVFERLIREYFEEHPIFVRDPNNDGNLVMSFGGIES